MPHYHGLPPRMQEPVLVSDASPGPNYAITLAEVKNHLRIDGSDEDDILNTYIAVAHERLNGWNGELSNALITQTWRVDFHRFPAVRRLDLPMGPVQSVTLKYYDDDNTLQTQASSKYAILEDGLGPYLYLDESEDHWPDTYEREDAVQVTMVLGYGTDSTDVPQPIRMAMLHMVAAWHRWREPAEAAEGKQIPWFADMLLENYRNRRF